MLLVSSEWIQSMSLALFIAMRFTLGEAVSTLLATGNWVLARIGITMIAYG